MSQSEIERLREINAELLEACKEGLWLCSIYGEKAIAKVIVAAIAKAEGVAT